MLCALSLSLSYCPRSNTVAEPRAVAIQQDIAGGIGFVTGLEYMNATFLGLPELQGLRIHRDDLLVISRTVTAVSDPL